MLTYRPMFSPQQRAFKATISSSLISILRIKYHRHIIWNKRQLLLLKKGKDQGPNKIIGMVTMEEVDHLKGVVQLLKNKQNKKNLMQVVDIQSQLLLNLMILKRTSRTRMILQSLKALHMAKLITKKFSLIIQLCVDQLIQGRRKQQLNLLKILLALIKHQNSWLQQTPQNAKPM